MLTNICQYLHNYFDKNQEKYYGEIQITDNQILVDGEEISLIDGQYFRIIGSLLNDGVHQYPSEELLNETFDGAIWSMAVPRAVLALSEDINEWQEKHGSIESTAMSPFTSESFGGYSYSKAGSTGADGGNEGWQSAFAYRLKPWRKLPM